MPYRAILHMEGMETMSDLRSLFESLLILSVLVATGAVLAILFR